MMITSTMTSVRKNSRASIARKPIPELAAIVSATTSQPSRRERIPDTVEDRRQRPGQDNPANQLPSGQARDTPEFQQLGIDLPDPQHGVHVDREGDTECDKEDFGALTYTQPDDDQRQHGEERDCPQHQDRSVE